MSPRTRREINGYVCACGQPAVAIRDSSYVCARCRTTLSHHDMIHEEGRDMQEHITRQERAWMEKTKWYVNRGYRIVRDKKRATATIL